MTVTGQLFGREAIREGYTHDSMGLPIDPGAIYNWSGIRYTEITRLVRAGITAKKTVPLVRKP